MATAIAAQPLAPHQSPTSAPIVRPLSRSPVVMRTPLKTQASENGARSRKERPCDGCRRRKSKCVLQDGASCVLCEFHKQDCTFVEAAVPRKRKPVDDPSRQDGPPLKTFVTLDKQPEATPRSDSVLRSSKAASPQDTMQALDDTLSLQRHRHCRYIGRTSTLDTSLLTLSEYSGNNETTLDSGSVKKVADGDFFALHADSAFPTYDDELQALYSVEQIVAPHGPALIDMYFVRVHPSFPIVQKHVFLNRHRHGDRQFNPALLAGMYLLALQWWDQDPVLAQQPKPYVQMLEDVAFRSLTAAMQRPKLSALQAGLLLLQRHRSNAFTLTVQLVALAQDLGLNLDCSEWSIPLWERRIRKRVAWALYIQDKWTGLTQGRPSHIQAADWAVPGLVASDFVEEVSGEDPAGGEDDEEAENSRIIFTQMVELTGIMAEVIDAFYTQKAISEFRRAGKQATGMILGRAKPVQLKLKEWFARLPAAARMDSVESGKLSSNGYLHLAYFATEISIHRRIVQSLSPTTTDPYMLYICRSAAKTRLISAMDFTNRLKPEHLDSFWYFASATNFGLIATFGNLLRATAPGREEAGFYESRLREYRWSLSVSARKAAWIEDAVSMLDVTNRMLDRMPAKPDVRVPAAIPQSRPREGGGVRHAPDERVDETS